jgi:TolB-like protein/tetratricopeptide (TPR) repeat protein
MSLLAELKRRNVFRAAIGYVVVAWLILQVADVVINNIGAPDWVFQVIMLVLGLGFPLVLVFAWAFEMTPDGLKKEKDVDRNQSITNKTGRKLDFTIIGIMAVALSYFVWESRFQDDAAITPETVIPANAGIHSPPTNVSTLAANNNSIAVLPFANRSRSEDDAFFSDGIHDDLLTQLAKIRDLKVISRTSVMKYKGTEKTIPEIAQELGVSTILEGGIQRAGKRIRINAQLIDVATDQHLWAETFDREMTVENIFDIQSEITRHIVQAVRGEMTEEEELKLSRVPTNNLQAYEAYLQALSLINRADYSQENYIEAEIWANKAVELDPKFAQTWAMLVEIHAQATWLGYDSSPERFANAKTALDNSIFYGPDLPETIAAQAEYQYRIDNDYKKAVETFKRALLALPGDIGIIHSLAVAQRRAGFLEDSIDTFEKALKLDPAYSRSATTMIETLLNMNEVERVASQIDNLILRYPDARDLRIHKVLMHTYQGELESARILMDSMTPWGSAAYYIMATLLPIIERDYEEIIAVHQVPEIALLSDNRSFMGLEEIHEAWAFRLLGDEQSALNQANLAIKKLTSIARTNTYIDGLELSTLAEAYAFIGDNDLAIATARESLLLIPEDSDALFGTDNSEIIARVLAMAGEREEALVEIERLLQQPTGFNPWMLYLDPRWDFFRDDERFNALAKPEGVEESEQ